MAIKGLSDLQFVQRLKEIGKAYYTVSDLEKILEQKRQILYVTLNRLVKQKVLERLKRDVYISSEMDLSPEKIANELYNPSYLSFESALSKYGIMSQIPYVVTFATLKSTKRFKIGKEEIEFRKLNEKFFFGYKLESGYYIAGKEKAVLDQLYLISKGLAKSDLKEWDLDGLDLKIIRNYCRKYPKNTKDLLEKLLNQ